MVTGCYREWPLYGGENALDFTGGIQMWLLYGGGHYSEGRYLGVRLYTNQYCRPTIYKTMGLLIYF